MSLLDKLTKRQQVRAQSTAEQYRSLLERLASAATEPTDKDVEALDILVSQLRFTASQVDDDIATLRTLNGLYPVAAKEPALKAAHEEAAKVLKAKMDQIRVEAEKLRAEELEVSGKRSNAHAAWQSSVTAIEEIKRILGKSPHLRK